MVPGNVLSHEAKDRRHSPAFRLLSVCYQYYDEGKARPWGECIREDGITQSKEPWEGFRLEG